MISLIQNSFQQSFVNSLTENILAKKNLIEKKIKLYKEIYFNATNNSTNNQNLTEKEIKIAVFFNETGISDLEQTTTNQFTEGIKHSFVEKYFKSVSNRMKFSEEVLRFFQPIFLKATEQTDEWKSYELMYNPNDSENINFINFLVRNKLQEKKIDVIVNQVNLKYKISKFILIEESSIDKNGKEEKEVKFITEHVEKKDINYEVEVIKNVITYTAYNSLVEFLNIKGKEKFLTFLG